MEKHFIPGKPAMMMILFFVMFSCSKSNDTTKNTAPKYCSSIAWSDTDGRTGSFTGTVVNNTYELTSVAYKEPLTAGSTVSFTYDASGHLMNQTGLQVTYNQNYLASYVADLSVVSNSTGTATYTFDSNGYLLSISVTGTDQNGPLTLSVTYTYDSNGDPVHIVGHGTGTVPQGIGTIDYDITADYLTDKGSFVPFIPIAAPFSTYFTYGNILSNHLINKLVIKQNENISGFPIPELDFTQQYTYTFDSNGRIATFFHSGSPNNIYTVTYTGCN